MQTNSYLPSQSSSISTSLPINISDSSQSNQHQPRKRIVTSVTSASPLNRISTSFRQRSFHQDDNKQRRLSTWAVFGAVIDQESFSRSMSDHTETRNTQHVPPLPGSIPHHLPPTQKFLPQDVSISDEPTSNQSPPLDPFNILPINESLIRDTLPAPHSKPTSSYSTKIKSISQSIWTKLPTSFRTDFRVILKCSIAYLIASLFSFYDPLSDLLVLPFGLDGPFSGAHVIATIVTYYRPAATAGKMMEANHYAIWGLFWLAVIIVGSTLTSVLIQDRIISHAIILIVFVGFGYGSMAWVKLKSPGFASTCSMIIVISSVIITREGSIHYGYLDFKKSLIYTEVILIGVFISNLTCLGFWRGSATDTLQKDINKTLDSFATLIGMLTKTFLLDETIFTDQDQLKHAIDRHHSSFTSLKESLNGAVYEFFEPRIQRSQANYKELISSMNRLAQHLTGLRSGCSLQYELLDPFHLKSDHKPVVPNPSDLGATHTNAPEQVPDLQRIKDVFVAFCEATGPSLKNLMATGAACLHAIKTPTNQHSHHQHHIITGSDDPEAATGDGIDKIIQMRNHLSLMIQVFQESHSNAMRTLYHSLITGGSQSSVPLASHITSSTSLDTRASSKSQQQEEIFVICFFLFNMEEFMRELCHLLDIFVDIRTEEEMIMYETQLRSIRFRRRLDIRNWFKKDLKFNEPASRRKPRARRERPKFTAVLPLNPKAQRPFPRTNNNKKPSSSIQPNDGEQNATSLESETVFDRIKRKIYDFFIFFDDPDTKTCIKIGIGAAFMIFPAFWDQTRPIFHHYRAQWAVVTYMIVMAGTLGQTNFLVITRMVGTLIGSGVAIGAQYLFWEDAIILPIVGFLYSIPCFWLIVSHPSYASTGRFLLLSFNLVCVYSYNVRDKNIHLMAIAYNRCLCVFVGVLFGWMINSLVWPYKARRELRKCLSEFLLESAFLISFLVKHYSSKPSGMNSVQEHEDSATARDTANLTEQAHESSRLLIMESQAGLTTHLKSRAEELSKMELFLQVKLIRLFGLLSATRHEPRLKGPFPSERYRKMLNACQSMLDMIHSLRGVTVTEVWFDSSIREDFLLAAKDEHRELVGNLLLFFGLLSTSIELKSPLPPYLPPGGESRNRLLKKIHRKLSSSSHLNVTSDKGNFQINGGKAKVINYSLFFAFSVAIKHILIQLEIIGTEAQSLFGIIGGIKNLSEFDRIFSSV